MQMHIDLFLEQPGANALSVLRLLLPLHSDGERITAALAHYAHHLVHQPEPPQEALDYLCGKEPAREEA